MLKSSGRSVDGFCNGNRSDGHKSMIKSVHIIETFGFSERFFVFQNNGLIYLTFTEECDILSLEY